MRTRKRSARPTRPHTLKKGYGTVLKGMVQLLGEARRTSVRAVNVVMTATYWEIGRRIVEEEQAGSSRAGYGAELLSRLAKDLTSRFGRGFSHRNLDLMRAFYLGWNISQTPSARSPRASGRNISQTPSAKLPARPRGDDTMASLEALSQAFPLPWSHYVRLLTVAEPFARAFYEKEALRNGWSVRQLDRQIATRFHERTGASRSKERMLLKSAAPDTSDVVHAKHEPYLLEFLDLKDEYSESDLEQALIEQMEHFLLELGSDFAFVGRQRRLRVGKEWYRIDLLFFHRKLRCLVVIDLKAGRFTHADAGQMNLYLNYAREHWMNKEENPPVGLILCTEHDDAVARYAMSGIGNTMMAREYRLALPKEKKLEELIEKARKRIEKRGR